MAPFDEARIRAFVEACSTAIPNGQFVQSPDGLVGAILASDGLLELACNPLLLTILVLLWERGGRLPERRVDLYRVATETLVRDWPFHRLGVRVDEGLVVDLLGLVALRLVDEGLPSMGFDELLSVVASGIRREEGVDEHAARSQALEIVRLVEDNTGVLVETGWAEGERRYGFIHRSFADYLAARALADGWVRSGLGLAPFLHRERWEEVVRLMFGHVGTLSPGLVSRLLRDVLGRGWPLETHLHADLRLAFRVIGDGVRLDPELRDRLITDGIESFLEPRKELFRPATLDALTRVHDVCPASPAFSAAMDRAGDDAARLAKKALLRVTLWESDDAIAEALDRLNPLLERNSVPADDIARVLALALPDERPWRLPLRVGGVHGQDEVARLFGGQTEYWLGPRALERLEALGLRPLTLARAAGPVAIYTWASANQSTGAAAIEAVLEGRLAFDIWDEMFDGEECERALEALADGGPDAMERALRFTELTQADPGAEPGFEAPLMVILDAGPPELAARAVRALLCPWHDQLQDEKWGRLATTGPARST